MLPLDQIKTIAAQKGLQETIVEKDYILDWLLFGIANSELKETLAFKGGTALHKMYFENWRFSQDLDFTAISVLNYSDVLTIFDQICQSVKSNSGIILKLQKVEKEPKNSDHNWYFEIKIQYIGPRGQSHGDLPTVTIHITEDEKVLGILAPKYLIAPYSDIQSEFFLLTYSLEEILAEKLRTVIYQRCWARDIYDTWRLLKENKNVMNLFNVLKIFHGKCLDKNFNPEILPDYQSKIYKQREIWEHSLRRQILGIPNFEVVSSELIKQVEQIFEKKLKIIGGEMLTNNYSIKYRKQDFEIEVQGDKNFVESKFNELLQLKIPSSKEIKNSEVQIISNPVDPGRKMSLPEFLNSKRYLGHSDRILLFAYYLEEYENSPTFHLRDIERCYDISRIPSTRNIPAYIGGLIKSGYLMETTERKDNKKTWKLTQTGSARVVSLPDSVKG